MLLLFYFYHLLIIPRTPMIPTVVLKLLHEIANNDFRCHNREAHILTAIFSGLESPPKMSPSEYT